MAYGHEVDVAAPPERVWTLWSDPTSWHEWNPDVRKMDLDGPFAVGTTGIMHTTAGRSHPIVFSAIQPGRSFRLDARPIPATTFRFDCTIVPTATGCRIGQAVSFGGLGSLLAPMMGRQVAAGFPAILEGLKRRAEAG